MRNRRFLILILSLTTVLVSQVRQIAPKEERRVLWYASDGLRGKIRCLRKLQGFDEGGDAGLNLAHVAIAVVGLDLHVRNARTLDSLLHARALNVEGVAGL